jgi:electron transfer flavoprotein alpha subunit
MKIFAYIEHKAGAADDTAAELAAAARKIDPSALPTAIVTGWGADLDAVCQALPGCFGEIWKVANEALAYPNAELVRQALVKIVPRGSILLVPHDHFGLDLSPGLSVKLNAAFVPDVLQIETVNGAQLNLVRQEFSGQVSAHVRCDWRVQAAGECRRRGHGSRQVIRDRRTGREAALSRTAGG